MSCQDNKILFSKRNIAVLLVGVGIFMFSPLPAQASFSEAMDALKRGEFSIFWQELERSLLDTERKAGASLNKLKNIEGMDIPLGEHAAALKLFTSAVENGDAEAMIELGNMYAGGVGVRPDKVLAYAWFTLALDMLGGKSDLSEVRKLRDSISEGMSAEQIEAATEVAAAIKTAIEY